MIDLKPLIAAPVFVALMGSASFASTFDGSTIRATTRFPTLAGSTSAGPFDKVVDSSVEFPSALFTPFFGPTFDFSGDTITITHAQSSHASATFNGWIFNDLNNELADFSGIAVMSDTTGFFSGDLSRLSFDDDNLYLNFQGLAFPTAGESIVLKVSFGAVAAVPLPAGLPLLAGGLGLLALWRRKGEGLRAI